MTKTINFKGRTYKITRELPITELLRSEGICFQFILEGRGGATRLYQQFTNGVARTISTRGRAETEYNVGNVWN